MLYPLKKQKYPTQPYGLKTFWFTLELPEDLAPGSYPVHFTLTGDIVRTTAKAKVVIEVKNAVLPKSDLK